MDRDDRDPWESRYSGDESETAETAETAERSEMSETAEPEETNSRSGSSETAETAEKEDTSETAERSEKSETVKDRPNINMYLPADVVEEMQIRFDELNARYRRTHGEAMEKNRDFYPAVIQAGITGEPIEELLDLE